MQYWKVVINGEEFFQWALHPVAAAMSCDGMWRAKYGDAPVLTINVSLAETD